MFWIFLFLKDFLQGCVRSTFSRKYKQHLFLKQSRDGCKNRLQPFDPLPPPLTASSSHLLKSPSSILNISYRITVWQDYRIDLPITSLKTSWAISLSPFFVLQTCSITCIADGCKMQSNVTKWLSLGYSWPSVSTWGSRMVAFKLQKYFDTH